MDFSEFREAYPAKEPRKKPDNDDELVLVSEENGLQMYPNRLNDIRFGFPAVALDTKINTYLWVIGSENVPVALEVSDYGKTLETGKLKHTNLTGGSPAHCGGELWFVSEKEILLSGDSGRYGPRTVRQLSDAVEAFRSQGFRVASLGFDEETGRSNTLLVGQPEWQ